MSSSGAADPGMNAVRSIFGFHSRSSTSAASEQTHEDSTQANADQTHHTNAVRLSGSRSSLRSGHPHRNSQRISSHHTTQPSSSSSHDVSRSSTQHEPSRRHSGPVVFSDYSTPAIPNSLFFASDFMVGAGMIVFQSETRKVLLLYEPEGKYWFFPKGRKDIGESLEQAALREAYEESGYCVDFLPLFIPTNAPSPPGDRRRLSRPCAEPIYVTTRSWGPRRRRRPTGAGDNGGEYFTYWYVGQIAADAVHEPNTGMPDELGYQSHLLTFEDAVARLEQCGLREFAVMLVVAWKLWQTTETELQRRAADDGNNHSQDV